MSNITMEDSEEVFKYSKGGVLGAEPSAADLPFYNGEPDIRGLWRPIIDVYNFVQQNGWHSRTLFTDVTLTNTALSTHADDLKLKYDLNTYPNRLQFLGWYWDQPISVYAVLVFTDMKDATGKMKAVIKVDTKMTSADAVEADDHCSGLEIPVSFDYGNAPANSIRVKVWINLHKPYFVERASVFVNIQVIDHLNTPGLSLKCQVDNIINTVHLLYDMFGGTPYYLQHNLNTPSLLRIHYHKMGVVHGGGKPYLTSSVPTACQIPGATYQVGRYLEEAVPIDCGTSQIIFGKKCVDEDPASATSHCELINSSNICVRCKYRYYLDPTTHLCVSCPTNCYRCTNQGKCRRCLEGYVFQYDGTAHVCTEFSSLPNAANLIHNPYSQSTLDRTAPPFTVEDFLTSSYAGDTAVYAKEITVDLTPPGKVFYYSFEVRLVEDTNIDEIYSHYDVVARVTFDNPAHDYPHVVKSVPFSETVWNNKRLKFDLQYFYLTPFSDPVKIKFLSKYPAELHFLGMFENSKGSTDDCLVPYNPLQCLICNPLKNLFLHDGVCHPNYEAQVGKHILFFGDNGPYERTYLCSQGEKACSEAGGKFALECYDGFYLENGFDGNPFHTRCTHCYTNCKTCGGQPDHCLSCNSNMYLSKTTIAPIHDECVTCTLPPNCGKCADYGLCAECEPSFYLINGVCSSTPPSVLECPTTCSSCLDTGTPVSTTCTACKTHPIDGWRYLLHEGSCQEVSQAMRVQFTYLADQKSLSLSFRPSIPSLPSGLSCKFHFNQKLVGVDSTPLGGPANPGHYIPGSELRSTQTLPLSSDGELLLQLLYKEKVSADGESIIFEVLEDLLISLKPKSASNNTSQIHVPSGEPNTRILGSSSEFQFLKKGNYSLSNTISFYKDTKATEIVKTASAYSSVAVKTVMGMSLVTLSGSFSSLLKLTQHIELIFFLNLVYMPDNLKAFLKYFSENLTGLFFDPFKYINTPHCLPKKAFEEQGLECYLIKNIGGIFVIFCLTLLLKLVIWKLKAVFLPFTMLNKVLNLSFFLMLFDAVSFDILLYVGLDFSTERPKSGGGVFSNIISGVLLFVCFLMIVWMAILSYNASKTTKQEEEKKSISDKLESKEIPNNLSPSSTINLKKSPEQTQKRFLNGFAQISNLAIKARPPGALQALSPEHISTPNNRFETINSSPTLKTGPIEKKTFFSSLFRMTPEYLFEDFKEKKKLKFHRLFEHLKLMLCCALLIILYDVAIGQLVSIILLNMAFVAWVFILVPWKKRFDNFVNLLIGLILLVCLCLTFFFIEFNPKRPALSSRKNYSMLGYTVMALLATIMTLSCAESLLKTFQILRAAYKWVVKTYLSKGRKKADKVSPLSRNRSKISSTISHKLRKPVIKFEKSLFPPQLLRNENSKDKHNYKEKAADEASLKMMNCDLFLEKAGLQGSTQDNLTPKRRFTKKIGFTKEVRLSLAKSASIETQKKALGSP